MIVPDPNFFSGDILISHKEEEWQIINNDNMLQTIHLLTIKLKYNEKQTKPHQKILKNLTRKQTHKSDCALLSIDLPSYISSTAPAIDCFACIPFALGYRFRVTIRNPKSA